LNVIARTVTPVSQIAVGTTAQALPRAPERNSVPGNPHEPREAVSAELALATPASRDFH
jgi:hypothetical protein